MKNFTLSGGIEMPELGIGTWLHGDTGNQMRDAVVQAVEMGYRHIDCAYIYLNEPKMGEAFSTIFEKGLAKREDLFVTGKLWGTEHAKDRVEAACRKSLADCQLDYFDLYLIHWPSGMIPENGNLPKDKDGKIAFSGVSIEECWLAMEDLVKKGLTRAIGVSNFNTKQLTQLMKIGSMKPVVLQVESNPRFQNEPIRKFCVKYGIQMVGYSPFGSPDLPWGKPLPHILVDPILERIGKEVNKSTAKVVLKYQLMRGICPIPKSIFPHELEANLNLTQEDWQLTEQQCKDIDSMETGERKIVPVNKLPDGTFELRDIACPNYPFTFDETFDE